MGAMRATANFAAKVVWFVGARDDQEGQTLVEYALILALMSLALVAGLTGLRNELANAFAAIGSALSAAAP
jgi:Flp pilus assembly pilin Flp